MTPAEEIRHLCDSLNPGGQSELARRLPSLSTTGHINSRTVRRWIAGKSTPTPEMLEQIRAIRPLAKRPPSLVQ